jgi:hypothetical protein
MAKSRAGANGDGTSTNKSQAIRDLLGENPKLKTSEVVAELGGKGVKVTPALVYLIKSKARRSKRRQKRERVAESSRQTGASNPVALVLRVRELAREVGGYKPLKQLVDVLAE